MKTGHVLVLLLLVILVVVIVQNSETATVKLLFWTFSTSRIVILFLMAALGFIAGYVARHSCSGRKKDDDGD